MVSFLTGVKVLALPAVLEPDTFYLVAVGTANFKMYLTDKSGTARELRSGASIHVGTTAPASPQVNDLWLQL